MSDFYESIDVQLRYNQGVMNSKNVLGINPICLSAPWTDSYLNICI